MINENNINSPIRLKQLREEQNLTQTEMAKFAGVARSTYTGYEIGTIDIPTSKLQKLADRFNVSIDYLLGNTSNKFIPFNSQLPFHRQLKRSREDANMSHEDLSKILNITSKELIELEKGFLFPSSKDLINKIKEVFNLSDKDFYTDMTSVNANLVQLEELIKERNHHIQIAKDLSENESLEHAKDFLLGKLKNLSLEQLIDIYKSNYNLMFSSLIDNMEDS